MSNKNFIKIIDSQNANLEIELQNIASKYKFAPKIIKTKYKNDKCIITMEKIDELCIIDKYGEEIPEYIWKEIHNIISILFYNEGIAYVDITGYNFIEKNGKIYIIDFGHAYYTSSNDTNWFLKYFLDNKDIKMFNPDFN